MLTRVIDGLRFWLERRMIRGAHYRLLLIAGLLGLISVLGGAAVLAVGSGFHDLGSAVWWAFLRLSDPGYLGDDIGAVNRTISTILTVLGYVVFLGALVAVMTQWLNARMARLEAGLTPVVEQDHVVVLGWTNRTATIVEELLRSEGRVRRFLHRHGARELHIVILAREVSAALVQDLREAVGEAWDERLVTIRSGGAINIEHLERVDYRNAAAILVPGSEFRAGSVSSGDTATVKTLLSLGADPTREGNGGEGARSAVGDPELPTVIAELFDGRKVPVARGAYPGPLELLASDRTTARLLAQIVRHPGLSRVYDELLSSEGNEIYLRTAPELAGLTTAEAAERFPRAVLMGLVRRTEGGWESRLDPDSGLRVERDDRLVLLSEEYEHTEVGRSPDETDRGTGGPPPRAGRRTGEADAESFGPRRLLVLGWNHKVPALVRELAARGRGEQELHFLSTVPLDRRERELRRANGSRSAGRGIRVEHTVGDYTDSDELARLAPGTWDGVLLLGSDRLRTEEESDARTILGSLLLDEMLGGPGAGPRRVVELLDAENLPLVERSGGEVLISPVVVSHILAQVALRPELHAVLDELFGAAGPEILFRPAARFGVEGAHSFREIQRAVRARGETALGVRPGGPAGAVFLNPERGRSWPLDEHAEIVALAPNAGPPTGDTWTDPDAGG